MAENVKRWWWSNTIQLAAVQLLMAFSGAYFTEYPPELWYGLMLKSLIDVIIRAKTTKGVK